MWHFKYLLNLWRSSFYPSAGDIINSLCLRIFKIFFYEDPASISE